MYMFGVFPVFSFWIFRMHSYSRPSCTAKVFHSLADNLAATSFMRSDSFGDVSRQIVQTNMDNTITY